ncbi:MAG: polysaccharide biosynthesis/export family protein [Planctomycetaceae bacterium]|nr:polysaccharide biosynthesis/export family protein [Planctomycetaceae bacterium]
MLVCAAFHPVHGIPVQELDVAACASHAPRSGRGTIDLSLLRQPRPDTHRVDSGDVLGVYVEGVLGRDTDVPPISAPTAEQSRPAVGYPIHVRDDGTIHLPLIPPVHVRGSTLNQVEQAIRSTYTGAGGLLRPGADRILVNLQRPRTCRVLVIRQEAGNPLGNRGASQSGNFETDKRGTGRFVSLAAYENDVLHALAETDGLPGLYAENAIYVIRSPRVPPHRAELEAAPTPPPSPALPPIPAAAHQASRRSAGAAELPPDAIWPPANSSAGYREPAPDGSISQVSGALNAFGHSPLAAGPHPVAPFPGPHTGTAPEGVLPEYVQNGPGCETSSHGCRC